jgi:putative hydrolase of the HAD superfamily
MSCFGHQLRVAPARCWMIGNSPKSDVDPALEAGLNAVLIPHPHTRGLETEDLQGAPGRFLQVECFSELRHHF